MGPPELLPGEQEPSGLVSFRLTWPWQSLLGFVRLVTDQRIFANPMSPASAWAQVEEWLRLPNVFTPEPTQRHSEFLRSVMREAGRSDLVPDAHLAALAIEYGLTLQSTDLGFARFSGLKNPLGDRRST